MAEIHWFSGLALGVLANGIAEVILACDLHQPWRRLNILAQRRRVVRWVVCVLGHVGFAMSGASLTQLILFALFSISAATDFETTLLPPDALMFGSVIFAMAMAAFTGGWPALRDVAVAQAFCFAVVTLGVAFLNLCDSGDIKLAMQFGALCGSLGAVAAGAFGVWLVAILLVSMALLRAMLAMPFKEALQSVMRRRPPQGPLLWCGFLLATLLAKVMMR
jgi:hypothetical protein